MASVLTKLSVPLVIVAVAWGGEGPSSSEGDGSLPAGSTGVSGSGASPGGSSAQGGTTQGGTTQGGAMPGGMPGMF